jgi:hypothetical protein
MPRIFFLDVPEYRPFIAALNRKPDITSKAGGPYVRFESSNKITVSRDETGLGEAVWFGALVAGFEGEIETFNSTELTIA